MMSKIGKAFVYVFLSVAAFISIFPFAWMIIGATNKSVDIMKGKISFGTYLFTNINNLLEGANIGIALWMSVKIAFSGTIIALMLCSMAGYGFEVFQSKRRDQLLGLLMLSMMVPFAAVMIPLFRMFSSLGLLDTSIAVILPTLSTAFLIFFFRQNTKAFPREILQAARVDGLGEIQAFFRIYIPTMKSTYAAAAIITFMNYWNSFLWPLIALQSPDKKTLPLIVSTFASGYSPDYGIIMVAIIIITIPTALVFFLMQKNFVEGVVGAVK